MPAVFVVKLNTLMSVVPIWPRFEKPGQSQSSLSRRKRCC